MAWKKSGEMEIGHNAHLFVFLEKKKIFYAGFFFKPTPCEFVFFKVFFVVGDWLVFS